MSKYLAVPTATVGVLLFTFTHSFAGVIAQAPGTDFLVVEGENFDSIDFSFEGEQEGWIVVTTANPIENLSGTLILPPDSNASGGAALYDQEAGPGFVAEEHSFATYRLQFATAGTYSLFYHYSMFSEDADYGNNDSFYLGVNFNEAPEQFGRSNLDQSGTFEGHFEWMRATLEDNSPATYTVTDAQLGTTLDFNIATREPGGALDAMVFSPNRRLRDRELDALLAAAAPAPVKPLEAGDADQDYDFDQLDLVKVQISAKYLTGVAATWGEGDWNGAPGGSKGSPPPGNNRFDQLDIVAALNPGHYLKGTYAALANANGMRGDGQTTIIYNALTGEVAVDAPAGRELTSVNIDSAASIFTGAPAMNLGGSFDNDKDNNIFKATFGSSFGSLSFGNVAQTGLSQPFVLNDLTVVGSLAGGGALGNIDLIYIPEPSTLMLVCLGLLGLGAYGRRRRAA
jgi:hypothetical protein